MKRYALDKASVLLVDDSLWMRSCLRQMLKAIGFTQIHDTSNGATALKIVESVQPDIILTDWEMRPMNGLDLAQTIRHMPTAGRLAPIVMISAYSKLQNVLDARNAGVTEFLVKPLSLQTLYQRLIHVIEHPRPFVESSGFLGPDRRRRQFEDYAGPKRRDVDSQLSHEDVTLTQEEISAIMNDTGTDDDTDPDVPTEEPS